MNIGVPKEIKNQEYRVGLTPGGVRELVGYGHRVLVETGAGAGIGVSDADYQHAGAIVLAQAEAIFAEADMIVKVKEPQPIECQFLRPGQIIFTYLHLAADLALAERLMNAGVVAIAYETITDHKGGLPLLQPMSEIAGRMSIQVGATALEKTHGGAGVLLPGVPGVPPGHVVIIGGGVVGTQAARVALGLGAQVTVLDKSLVRLAELDAHYGARLQTLYSTTENLENILIGADLVIGAVLIPGASAPKLVRRDMLAHMRPGSVLVDVAIDQGGCFETSRATTHDQPTYIVDNIVHYAVANMPGAVPNTSTYALTHATLPYIIRLANLGWRDAARQDPHLSAGINICKGQIKHPAVAGALGKHTKPYFNFPILV